MFYIFHGPDTHTQHETLNKLKKQLGDPSMLDLNTTKLDGKNLNFATIRQNCDTFPFLAPKRLVIVTDFFTNKPDKDTIKQLKKYLPEMPDFTRLIFLESQTVSSRSTMLKLAESAANGYQKQFPLPEGKALDHWIRHRVKQKKGAITPQATATLAANVGAELAILDQELEKLLLYVGPDGTIDLPQVNKLSPYVAEANIFDLVDALGLRNSRLAAQLLQRKINEGADPFYLFAMFIRQFRLLIQVKALADTGQRPPDIAKELKMHPFVAGKIYKQSQGFSLPQLHHIYRHLLDIDLGVKTGQTDMPTALELLIAALT
ncbi:MAG TPA: DNA polymerase III subunit delta [Anaerolineae bacterium]|nr:DNA polymerase III subunit delta [Anaerolineae bacterium]